MMLRKCMGANSLSLSLLTEAERKRADVPATNFDAAVRLLNAREDQLGWSQARAAEALGVDPRTIRRWESGKHEVPWWAVETLERISKKRSAA